MIAAFWTRGRPSALLGMLTIVVASTLAAPAAHGQDGPSPSDGFLLPDASITTQSDAASLEVNPAGLGFIDGGELAIGWQDAADDVEGLAQEGGAVFFAGGSGSFGGGFSVQWLDRPELGAEMAEYRKYSLGAALSSEKNMSVGAAFNFFGSSDSEVLDDVTSWDLGFQWRPSQHVGFAAHIRDLNQPFLGDEDEGALPIRTSLGTALRFWNGRAVLSSAFAFTSDGDSIFLRPRLLIEPIDGVRLFARTEFDFESRNGTNTASWEQTIAGLALNTSALGIESAAILDTGDDAEFAGQTHLAWVGAGKRRSFAQRDKRWILVDLTGGIAEQPVSSIFGPSVDSFMSLLVDLEMMAQDSTVEGVVLNVGQSDLGYGQIWEVRQAVERLQKAGKRTVSMLTNPTFRETYLASAAEKVWLLPAQPYSPDGLSLSITTYAEALAKAGIEAEFVRIGRFKSAPESYTYRQPSRESLSQTNRYLDGLYSRTIQALAQDRDMTAARVKEMVDNVPLLPDRAVEQGFVDDVVYLDHIRRKLEEDFGVRRQLERGYERKIPGDMRWGISPEVAVVVIEGAIVRGRSGRTPIINQVLTGSDTLTQIFDRLRRDANVRAVVVRIDSPGGSAVASDLIFREMRRLAEAKPVVASMGNIAASGGYYVAAAADEIYASPNTLTGSIGIFSGKFSISRLADVIGINSTQLERGERSGSFDLYHPWTEQERDSVSRTITYLYKLFLQQVARGRPLSAEEVDAVARGRIWDGASAEDKKLVDQMGGLMDAIHRAESLAGLQPGAADYKIYPKTTGVLDVSSTSVSAELLGKLFGDSLSRSRLAEDSALAGLVRRLGKAVLLPSIYQDGEALMLLPQVIEPR